MVEIYEKKRIDRMKLGFGNWIAELYLIFERNELNIAPSYYRVIVGE